ncbi:peptidoglycan recognition protein family protein [Nonomuraea polychroma]|uniref:peptidoglycan recognition protein family protein n=1 Tax=Nonomuraea polychroma TaxID=46176 RepID=UPI003D8E15C7
MKFVARSTWAEDEDRDFSTNITPGKGGVAIHYLGGKGKAAVPHSRCASVVRSIENYHVNHNGWAGIAYNLLVCSHGTVFEGRGRKKRSAANGTNRGNQNWYAVCAMVNEADDITDALLHGLADAIAYLVARGGARKRVTGHGNLFSTSCPGSTLRRWVAGGARRPGTSAPDPGGKPATPTQPVPAWPGRMLQVTRPTLMSGPDVELWQRRMRKLGYRVTPDGVYGTETAKATGALQRARGLDGDEIVGPLTWRAGWATASP